MQPYVTDGTAAGTVRLSDSLAFRTSNQYVNDISGPKQFTAVGGELFFIASDGIRGNAVWRSDGTAAGTGIVSDALRVGDTPPGLPLPRIIAHNGSAYFAATDGVLGNELYRAPAVPMPTANAGGPYAGVPSSFIPVSGAASKAGSSPIVSYEWDLDYHGKTFHTDATGIAAQVMVKSTPANSQWVALRVTDADGNTNVATAPVNSVQAAVITGKVYIDGNGNGTQDAGEQGQPNVTVYIDVNVNGSPDAGDVQTTTDSSGNYTFDNLNPLKYTIREVVPSGYNQTAPAAGSADVTAVSGQTAAGPTFGNAPAAAITSVSGASLAGVEGTPASGVLATFHDSHANALSTLSATIQWGDGGSGSGTVGFDAASGNYQVSGSHTYAFAGVYHPSVAITDSAGGSATPSATVNVADAALAAFGASISPTTTQVATAVVGSFTDADLGAKAAYFTADIDWGDGAAHSAGTVSLNPQTGRFDVGGAHTFAKAGQYTLLIQVQDSGGAGTLITSAANVGPITPPPGNPLSSAAGTRNLVSIEGYAVSGILATFKSTDSIASHLSAAINWGDNSSSAGAVTFNKKANGRTYVSVNPITKAAE